MPLICTPLNFTISLMLLLFRGEGCARAISDKKFNPTDEYALEKDATRNGVSPSVLRAIQDPASQRLTWYKPPLTVLVIKKVRDSAVLPPFVEMVTWLIQVNNIVIIILILNACKNRLRYADQVVDWREELAFCNTYFIK